MEHGTTERSWTIRPLTEADIEAYLDIYLNSYPAYKSLDEECRQHYRDKHRLELQEDRQVQTVARDLVLQPEIRQVVAHRLVPCQALVLHQQRGRGRGHRLGDRTDPEQCVGRHRQL